MTNPRDLIQRMAKELDLYRQMARDDCTSTHPFADEARAYLAQPEPEGPTDEELEAIARAAEIQHMKEHGGLTASTPDGIHTQLHAQRIAGLRAVAARWGRPAIEPVSVDERLPEAEDCDGENQCWQWDPKSDAWVLYTSVGLRLRADVAPYWLPHHALPVPQNS